jgi:hypothetical protein
MAFWRAILSRRDGNTLRHQVPGVEAEAPSLQEKDEISGSDDAARLGKQEQSLGRLAY